MFIFFLAREGHDHSMERPLTPPQICPEHFAEGPYCLNESLWLKAWSTWRLEPGWCGECICRCGGHGFPSMLGCSQREECHMDCTSGSWSALRSAVLTSLPLFTHCHVVGREPLLSSFYKRGTRLRSIKESPLRHKANKRHTWTWKLDRWTQRFMSSQYLIHQIHLLYCRWDLGGTSGIG